MVKLPGGLADVAGSTIAGCFNHAFDHGWSSIWTPRDPADIILQALAIWVGPRILADHTENILAICSSLSIYACHKIEKNINRLQHKLQNNFPATGVHSYVKLLLILCTQIRVDSHARTFTTSNR